MPARQLKIIFRSIYFARNTAAQHGHTRNAGYQLYVSHFRYYYCNTLMLYYFIIYYMISI